MRSWNLTMNAMPRMRCVGGTGTILTVGAFGWRFRAGGGTTLEAAAWALEAAGTTIVTTDRCARATIETVVGIVQASRTTMAVEVAARRRERQIIKYSWRICRVGATGAT